MEGRKKHGWPFWFGVMTILLPVLYVASSGPALLISIWISARPGPDLAWPKAAFEVTYAPLGCTISATKSQRVVDAYIGYLDWWTKTFRPMLGPGPF